MASPDPGSTHGLLSEIVKSLLGGSFITGTLVLLRAMWNSRIPMRKLKNESDTTVIETLKERLTAVEAANERLMAKYESKIEALTAENKAQEALQERREAVLRHELQNIRTCFNALMIFLKRMPNQSKELTGIIEDVETMRAEQLRAEELERSMLMTPERGPLPNPALTPGVTAPVEFIVTPQ